MLIPNLYTVPEVMAASGYTEEQALQWGYFGDIVFMVLVPEIGACRVPELALSHFMAGVDDYIAEGMPEHYSSELSGRWTIKRERLRILAESWEAFSKPWRQQAAIILAADARAIAEKAAKEGKVTLDVLASEISQKLVVRDRGNEFADDSMGLTVAATRYKIGVPSTGVPGVRALMLKMVAREDIMPLAVSNSLPPVQLTDVSTETFPAWYLSEQDVVKVRGHLIKQNEVTTETTEQRCVRYLAMFEAEVKREKRGALQRVADAEGVDRSNMKKDINKARAARDQQKRAGTWTSQLVKDGKHRG